MYIYLLRHFKKSLFPTFFSLKHLPFFLYSSPIFLRLKKSHPPRSYFPLSHAFFSPKKKYYSLLPKFFISHAFFFNPQEKTSLFFLILFFLKKRKKYSTIFLFFTLYKRTFFPPPKKRCVGEKGVLFFFVVCWGRRGWVGGKKMVVTLINTFPKKNFVSKKSEKYKKNIMVTFSFLEHRTIKKRELFLFPCN